MTTPNKAQHTPGPWRVIRPADITIARQGNEDADIVGIWSEGNCTDVAFLRKGKRHDANARLIAAAPELLEACREALDDLERINHSYQCGESPTWDLLRTAINRAEGRAE